VRLVSLFFYLTSMLKVPFLDHFNFSFNISLLVLSFAQMHEELVFSDSLILVII
jgi:hypothetical protein